MKFNAALTPHAAIVQHCHSIASIAFSPPAADYRPPPADRSRFALLALHCLL
jgi:hypothetical protein